MEGCPALGARHYVARGLLHQENRGGRTVGEPIAVGSRTITFNGNLTMQVWIEAASGRDEHGGEGWELGRCIWSPANDRLGRTQKYGIMNSPRVGDPVINCSAGLIVGISRVCRAAETTTVGPPNPGAWGYARSFFRLNLDEYAACKTRIPLNDVVKKFFSRIREDIESNRPKYYLFSLYPPSERNPTGKLVLAQGRFLARSTPTLDTCITESLAHNDRVVFESRIKRATQR